MVPPTKTRGCASWYTRRGPGAASLGTPDEDQGLRLLVPCRICVKGMYDNVILLNEKVPMLLKALSEHGKVLVPAVEGGIGKFIPYEPDCEYDLGLVNTILPPKDALFPQTQKMYKFKTGAESGIEEITDADDQIIFGIRPCDVQSISCLDKVFLTLTFVDGFYARSRDKLTTIAIACTKPNPTCFCESMGVDPGGAPEADIMLIPAEEGWSVKAQSEKGKKLIDKIGADKQAIFADGNGKPLPAAATELKVNMDGVAEKLDKLFEHPIWDDICRPCLGCGTCTFMCPTCYCFEMTSETRGAEGTESRHWDSCMFPEYSRMAGGHNPRPTGKERVRNRYMHKLCFFAQRYGMGLCVGCGRCIEKCPVGMDITKVIDFAGEAETV